MLHSLRSEAALGIADRQSPVAQTEPTLYACRNWIEQGFTGPENCRTDCWVGKWHRTRRLDPTRVGRHWLVLAIATWHVLCDQGLCSRDLWAQIVALGWHGRGLRHAPRPVQIPATG